MENQNFEKIKKAPGDITLHMCTKNHDHLIRGWGGGGWLFRVSEVLYIFLTSNMYLEKQAEKL